MAFRNQFLKYHLHSMAGEDDLSGGGGDSGNGGDDDPSASAVDADKFNQLVSTVGGLAENMQSIQNAVSQLAQPRDNSGSHDDSLEDDNDNISDLEVLSREDFAKHIINQINKQVGGTIEKLDQKINEASQNIQAVDSKAAVQKFAESKADFWDWKDELKSIVNDTPGISVERAYLLARQENPEKAKKLDAKYSPTDDKGKPKFGGLTPTSGQTAKSTTMSSDEAAEKAWQDSMSDLESVLVNENV